MSGEWPQVGKAFLMFYVAAPPHMPAAWVTSRAVAAGAYKTGDMSFKSDKTHRHLFWWMCGQLMQLAQMETSGSSDGGGGPLLSLPLPGEVSAMQPVHLKQWMASEAAVCKLSLIHI